MGLKRLSQAGSILVGITRERRHSVQGGLPTRVHRPPTNPSPRGCESLWQASKFSEAQKAFILRQGNDGVPVAEICRKAGISQATYFNWKKKYDGPLPTEMRKFKQLEDENAKLKKLVANLSLDKEMLQDVIRRKL